jgi:hypothetical protein
MRLLMVSLYLIFVSSQSTVWEHNAIRPGKIQSSVVQLGHFVHNSIKMMKNQNSSKPVGFLPVQGSYKLIPWDFSGDSSAVIKGEYK